MANIIKTESGYIIKRDGVPDVFLSNQDAFEVMQTVDRQYHLEDVRSRLEEKEDIDESVISEEDINKICDEYEDRLEDDDSWSYTLDDVIQRFRRNEL